MSKRKLTGPLSVWDQPAILSAFAEHNIKSSHATKLWSYLIRHPGGSWNDVPDMPKAAIELLDKCCCLSTSTVVKKQTSQDGETTKLLVKLQDGLEVESVIMHYDTTGRGASSSSDDTDSMITTGRKRATLCVSSQVGCQMGCTFCATGTMGLKGNLTSGEIIEQLMHAQAVTSIRNIVFMGMGEPLNNYEAVKAAVGMMTDSRLFGLSRRHVTVSTVGVVPRLLQLADDLPGVSLALSLHAPNQELRQQIVPSAKAYKLEKLIAATVTYQEKTGQRIFIEYVVIRDVNDGLDHAHELGALLRGRDLVVNYIPWNPVYSPNGPFFSAPDEERVRAMQRILKEEYQLPCTVRQEKGQDVAGACGQLVVAQAHSDSCSKEAKMADIEEIVPAPSMMSTMKT